MGLLDGVTIMVVDTETTGFDPAKGDRLVEVARVTIANGRAGETWSSLVHPGRAIPPDAAKIHGITDAMVAGAPRYAEVGRALREQIGDHPIAFHNAPFDLPFLVHLFREAGAPPLVNPVLDTLGLARGLWGVGSNGLGAVAQKLGVTAGTAHRALGDATTTANVLLELVSRWEAKFATRSFAELAAESLDIMRKTSRPRR
ncbi:MAG: 3'-5' exonuclease [Candidatus Eisenbacteria bacterium]|uniref:3'-5' exonuclease n=1 Tax=Eiseniibacteriota bacterium TaxID=2212470 RepID=A0A933W3U5_UNCEI|nr:3'-5' exonuclease [Candidatus Eisenbacteria bacterium]